MTKTYIAPATQVVNLTTEGMVALSLRINPSSSTEKVTEDTQVLSNDRAWSSENWMVDEE